MAEPSRGVVTLAASPSALAGYRRALLQRGHGGDRVPARVLRLAGVRPDVEQVRRYVDVCGGRLSDSLPLLYPHLLGFGLQIALLTDPDSPFAAMGLVHVTNSVLARGAVPLDAALDVQVSMSAPAPHRRGRTIDLLSAVAVAGEEVWSSRSTYLHRERGSASDAPSPEAGPGSELLTRPGAVWRLPADLGRRYGAVSGDRNPIHMSGVSARLFGFRTAIAHGMWTAARCLAALEGRLPPAVRYDVEFRRPVPLPGSVEFADDGASPEEATTRFVVRSRRAGRDGVPDLHLTGSLTAP